MAEICAKFDYSYGRLYTLRMRYQIPSIHAFGTTCYPKEAVDKAVSEERERLGRTLNAHWYCLLMIVVGIAVSTTVDAGVVVSESTAFHALASRAIALLCYLLEM